MKLSVFEIYLEEHTGYSRHFFIIHSRDMKTQHIKFERLNERLSLFKCNLIQLNFGLNTVVNG